MGPSRECDGDAASPADRAPSSFLASMGPSRECDGDEAKAKAEEEEEEELQWGRRVNATETIDAITLRVPVSWLQWGRRVNATETHAQHADACGRHVASMGPSRECDGDPEVRGRSRVEQLASMGPSRECDGDPMSSSMRRSATASFNGAVA